MRIVFARLQLSRLSGRLKKKFSLPERLKGTIVEKWSLYWKGLVNDYAEVGMFVVKEAFSKPKKALIIASGGYGMYLLAKNNPDDAHFIGTLRTYTNDMGMVSVPLRNPTSVAHLELLNRSINEGTLRVTSLGIFSLLWLDMHNGDLCVYKAICKYTGVGYWNFHERVMDIGLWNRWWYLDWKMHNYDINYI